MYIRIDVFMYMYKCMYVLTYINIRMYTCSTASSKLKSLLI